MLVVACRSYTAQIRGQNKTFSGQKPFSLRKVFELLGLRQMLFESFFQFISARSAAMGSFSFGMQEILQLFNE